jgi:hypothetical protein
MVDELMRKAAIIKASIANIVVPVPGRCFSKYTVGPSKGIITK